MKKILITGSSSGIGRAMTERLLSQSYHVIGLARHHQKFSPDSSRYSTYSIDFAKIESLEAQFKLIHRDHQDLDALICCAGYGEFCELEQFSVKNMQNIMNVNFLSQAILIKIFLASFKKKKSGKILLIGSECALEGQKKGTLYCASKFALRGFAQSLRKECAAANVSVTLINPGIVDTAFFETLSFYPAIGEEHAIQPMQLATLITTILTEENNCVYEEIQLQPMKKVIKKK